MLMSCTLLYPNPVMFHILSSMSTISPGTRWPHSKWPRRYPAARTPMHAAHILATFLRLCRLQLPAGRVTRLSSTARQPVSFLVFFRPNVVHIDELQQTTTISINCLVPYLVCPRVDHKINPSCQSQWPTHSTVPPKPKETESFHFLCVFYHYQYYVTAHTNVWRRRPHAY